MLNGPLCIHSVYVARYYCENLYFIPCFLLDKQKKKLLTLHVSLQNNISIYQVGIKEYLRTFYCMFA